MFATVEAFKIDLLDIMAALKKSLSPAFAPLQEHDEARAAALLSQPDGVHTCWWYLCSISSWAERTRT